MQVVQLRNYLTEATHPVSVAVARLDAHGKVVVQDHPTPHHTVWRSAAKPFQLRTALGMLARHGQDTLPAAWLAIGASSHSGAREHTEIVRAILDHFGLTAAALRCGPEMPVDPEAARALVAADAAPGDIHNDCSGKHAFMLAATRLMGWPLAGYLSRAHPLQQAIMADITALAGAHPAVAVDGCGVPTAYLSLGSMARAWLALARSTADEEADPLLHRIGSAMANHPFLTSGAGRIDLAIAQRATEPYIGKIGALGVFCLALPERQLAVALKVHSGNEDALAVAVPAVLDTLAPGALAPPPGTWPWATVKNVVGTPVGRRLVTGLGGVY